MKKVTIMLMAFVLGITTMSVDAYHHGGKKEKKYDSATPKVTAALFYADWCGSCKTLDPKLKKAKKEAKLSSKDVLFVTFDLTNNDTKHQSKLLANSLGLGELYRDNRGKTGYVALIDNKNGQQITKITKKQSTREIAQVITNAL